MAITTTWKVDSLECKIEDQGFSDVVYTIHWRLHATEGDATTSIYGSQSVNFDPTDPDYEFVPYEDLDEETVTTILEGIMNPVVESKPLPWNS